MISNLKIPERTKELFAEQEQSIVKHTDGVFARLMVCQWLFGITIAIWISPFTWAGSTSTIHIHVWSAAFLGAAITSLPVFLAIKRPGNVLTRHAVAVGQMLMSALLIHLTGGRIETHFHVFGSLAILAFYRDWKVLVSASVVVYADHLLRGVFWPQSVYGVLAAPIWRSFEHAGWVVFEVAFLFISIRKSQSEMLLVAERQANLEALKESIEQTVSERTAELVQENAERRQAETQLRTSQSQLAQAQQIAKLGNWEWDIVANRVTWSEETQRLYGHPPDAYGSPMDVCLDRVHPEDRSIVSKVMATTVQTGEPFVCDHRVLLADGTDRIIHGRGELLRNAAGQAVKLFGTVQDITDRKRAEEALRHSEEQLRQSQKMEAIGRLAGGVAHDFNNLLTVISGYCSLALHRMEDVHPLRKSIHEIQKASERASSLTGQLLAFSRKQVLQPRVLQLTDVIGGMEKMLRRLIGEDIELATSFGKVVGHVKADPGQIEQVIMNLAVNARDAMPRGGRLTISTANVVIDESSRFKNRVLTPGNYVMLAVSDNGMGMTEQVKTHLFEPFFTTKGVGKGTGLGLATCYGIICQSGGDIRVYSEPERGTTFKIYLPRVDCPADTVVPDLSPTPRGHETILVVEDDAAVRELTVLILRENGYRVSEANNAFEALAMMRRDASFALVLTDVIMPQMSGKQLYDEIKNQLPDTKVLLMSGYTDDALAHHGVLDEGLSFLEKPFSPTALARKVREVIDAPTKNGRAADTRLKVPATEVCLQTN